MEPDVVVQGEMEDSILNMYPPPPPETPRLPRLAESATSDGVEFEHKEAGLAALRARKLGLHFQIFSNVAPAKPFDDLILRLAPRTSPRKWTTYFIQMKHSEKRNPLSLQTFVQDKQFVLKKYFKFFLQLRTWHHSSPDTLSEDQRFLCEGSLDDCRLVIFTTRPGWWGAQNCEDEGIHKMAQDILNTGGQNCVKCFSDTDQVIRSHLHGDKDEQIYQDEFLPLLRIYCDQSISDLLDSLIKEELQAVFGKPLPQLKLFSFQYIEFLKQWAKDDSRNYCLTENSDEFEWIIAQHLRREAIKISKMEFLEFKVDDPQTIALRNALDSNSALAIQVPDVPAGVRAAKVLQLLEIEHNDSWIYVNSEVLKKYDLKTLTAVCLAQRCQVLVLDTDVVPKELKALVLAVARAVKVVDFGFCLLNATADRVPFARLRDEWMFTQLTETAQEEVLDKPILFQGEPLPLRSLEGAWPRLRWEATGALLGAVARGDASLGAPAPPPLPSGGDDADEERLYIPRGLRHCSALSPEVLGLASADDHLALQGFSERALRRLREAHGWSGETARDRWTVLEEGNLEGSFEHVCKVRGALCNVHWVERVGGANEEDDGNPSAWALAWRRTRGRGVALAALVRPATAACAREAACVHRAVAGAGPAVDAAAWGERAALLVGPPGAGKSSFLRRVTREARRQQPARWALFVPVLNHNELLREMPEAPELTPSHVMQLLAAAAGAVEGAARLCLEAAVMSSGAVSLLIDGFDELCPAFKSKMLRLLEMLLQDTKAALVWVSSRPEIETSLHAVLRCPSVSLTSITEEEQRNFLCSRWTSEPQFNITSASQLANKVIDAMVQHAPEDQSTTGLLAAPLHLRMMAEIFAKAPPDSFKENLKLNVYELYQKFVKLKENDYLKKHGFLAANLENAPFYYEEYFSSLHKNCAMFLMIRDKQFKDIDIKPFENFIKRKQQELLKAKTGLMWMDEDGTLHFVHFSFMEYFACCWLSENIYSGPARDVVRSMYESDSYNMSTFLNWMLTEGCVLHRALLARDASALNGALDAGEDPDITDGAGRTALHVAVALNDDKSSARLIREHCDVNARDSLFGYTPLQFADRHFRPSTERAGWVMTDRLMKTMERLLEAGAQHCTLRWFAANMRLAIDYTDDNYQEVMKLLMEHGMSEYDYIYALHRAESRFHNKIFHILLTHPLSQCWKESTTVSSGTIPLNQSEKLRLSRQFLEEHRKDHKAEDCMRPLHCHAYEGNVTLLQKEMSSSKNDRRNLMCGMTPLHVAVLRKQLECAEYLVEFFHFLDHADSDRFTPLHCAVEIGHVEMVQLLLKKRARVDLGAESGLTPLHLVVLLDRSPCLDPFHEYNSNLNLTDEHGFTPLFISTAMGRLSLTEKLLSMGADPNVKTCRETSALHIIAERNDEPAAKCVLQREANPHETDGNGRKPVHTAANHGSLDVMKTLLDIGVKVNSLSSDGKTPLHYACFTGQQKCVDFLLGKGCDVSLRDSGGRSALHCAAYSGHKQVVSSVLKEGVAVNQTTHFGSTPLTLAASNGHLDCVEGLLQAGAEVNGSNNGGFTALHGAAESGHPSVVETLLNAEANPDAKPDIVHTLRTPKEEPDIWSLFDFGSLPSSHIDPSKSRREVELLVEPGEVGVDTNCSSTPLTLAAREGHVLCVDCLIRHGVDVNLRDGAGLSPLHRACQQGHQDVAKALLEAGASINAESGDGTAVFLAARNLNWGCVDFLLSHGATPSGSFADGLTLLHCAAEWGKLQVVNRIMETCSSKAALSSNAEGQPSVSGAKSEDSIHSMMLRELNKPDVNGWTPLHHAANVGSTPVVEKLVAAGADVNAKTNEGRTPIVLATYRGNWKCVTALMENGAEVNDVDPDGMAPLHRAVKCKHLTLVNGLLNAGAVVNAPTRSGDTPLSLAVANGHLECVEALLDRGADPNHADQFGLTLIHSAAEQGHPDVLKRLLATDDAAVDATSNGGRTALSLAVLAMKWACVEVLLQHGASVDTPDPVSRYTALHMAVQTDGACRAVGSLLAAGAAVNAAASGLTPLMLAADTGCLECVKLLLERGADVSASDECLITPMHFAASRGQVDVLECLLKAGASANVKSVDGSSPLTNAAYNQQWECVRTLMRYGGDVNAAAGNGYTALHYAVEARYLEMVKELVDAGASIDALTRYGRTPLSLAFVYGASKCADYLLELEEKRSECVVPSTGTDA